jgi:hypothetical protein
MGGGMRPQDEVSIEQLIKAIKKLPSDEPKDNPRVWYKTQKEHWLGWLSEYNGPGTYGRIPGIKRNAKFTYNHVVNPQMLMYLIRAIPLRMDLVSAAEKAHKTGATMMEKSGAIRRVVSWDEVYQAFWGKGDLSLYEH